MTTDTSTAEPQTARTSRGTWNLRYVLVLGILCLPALALWGFGSSESSGLSATTQPMQPLSLTSGRIVKAAAEPVLTADEHYRQLIVGNWETDRDGKRFLTVSADGTAVMDVNVPGGWSLLFGEKMKFDIEWSIEDGVLTFETTGGEPKSKIDLITSMYGKERVQKIKKLDDTTLQLPDEDPESEDHIWTRVEPTDSAAL